MRCVVRVPSPPLIKGHNPALRVCACVIAVLGAPADRATGILRGVAFVRFSHRSEAEAAVNSLNNMVRCANAVMSCWWRGILRLWCPRVHRRHTFA